MNITPIIWADLKRLKKTAKEAKDTQPHLTYMQRLNVIAKRDYGVRHFHELEKRYEAQVAGHIDIDGSVYHCRLCSFTFDGMLRTDIKAHSKRHQDFEEAQAVLGFVPMAYKEREKIKRIGYEWMRSSNLGTQRQGALAVLLSHFERSMESAVENGRWHKHSDFMVYLACALPDAEFIPESIRKMLSEEFCEQSEVVPVDRTNQSSLAAFRLSSVNPSKLLRDGVLHAIKTVEKS